MIIRSAGFEDASLIGSQNALNFAYILYLTLRSQEVSPEHIEAAVRRWFVLSVLRGRYSSSPESTFDEDIRQLSDHGFERYGQVIIAAELSAPFWETLLPQEMDTSSSNSPAFQWVAGQPTEASSRSLCCLALE